MAAIAPSFAPAAPCLTLSPSVRMPAPDKGDTLTTSIRKIKLREGTNTAALFGSHDRHLKMLEEAFGVPGPLLFVAMHFGAVEYPALFAVARTGRHVTAPMETLGDPALQAWLVRTRGSVGVDIVTLREARRALTGVLAAGGTVGLVADRNVAGGTVDVPFFGATAIRW